MSGMKSSSSWMGQDFLPMEPDPRTNRFALMQSWTTTAMISIIYVAVVYIWRAGIVRKQKSVQGNKTKTLTKINISKPTSAIHCLMIIYNMCMVIYSTIIVIGILWGAYIMNYGIGCETLPDPNDQRTDILLYCGYYFYVSKFVEMLDTLFFLWRNKVDQVSFLHVFHHASMPPSLWFGVRYAPGGINFLFPLTNSFIHVLMYTYYGLAAAGATRHLWWKQYLTLGQMIQFLILIGHQGQVLWRSQACNFPRIFPLASLIYGVIFLALFTNFYVRAYWLKQRLAKVDKSKCSMIQHEGKQSHQNGNLIKSTKQVKQH